PVIPLGVFRVRTIPPNIPPLKRHSPRWCLYSKGLEPRTKVLGLAPNLPPFRGAQKPTCLHSRRQPFANAAIAASRVVALLPPRGPVYVSPASPRIARSAARPLSVSA